MLFDYSFGFITVKSRNHDGILGSFALGFLTSVAWVPCYSAYLMSLISLLVSGIFIFSVTKLNPVEVYQSMFKGAYGTNRRMWVTIRDTMMLLCIALGLAPAFKMRFWNIGAEGQVLVGGIATAGLMRSLGTSVPTPLLLIIMACASLICGAVWGMIPAIFKARWNANETLFTLMMNYIAIQLTSYCVALWENPFGSNSVGIINPKTQAGWFPKLFGQANGLNVVIVLLVTIGMYVYLKYSKQGYEIAVVGDSENTARYAGINVQWVTIRTMAISSAICGLAGFIAVSGASHTISTSTAGGQGFTAIIVAWLSQFNSFIMVLISLLIVSLQKGAVQIASQFNLNDYASHVITGIILFFILGSEFFINYRIIVRGKKGGDVK